MQEDKSINQKVLIILDKYRVKIQGKLMTQSQVEQKILLYGNSLPQWRKFLTPITSAVSRIKLLQELTSVLDLKNETAPPIPLIIIEYNQMKPVDANSREILYFKQLQLIPAEKNRLKINEAIQMNMRQNIQISTSFQVYLAKEIKQILQILQNRLSILDYYNQFIQLCKYSQKIFAKEFSKLKFIDFIIFLLKIVNYSEQVTNLLSAQEIPIPIKFKASGKLVNLVKSCRSFLKYNKYSLITNIGTKAALPYKSVFTNKLFDVNAKFTEGSIFEDNVNILSKINNRLILDCDEFLDLSLDLPFKQQTSILIVHLTNNDMQGGIIKKMSPLFQSIQRLLLIVWDGLQSQQVVQKQIFELLTQNSFIKKSINKSKKQNSFQQTIKDYIKINNLNSQKPQFPNIQENNLAKTFLNKETQEKRFFAQQFYTNKQNQIDKFLQTNSKQPVQKLIFNNKLSPFVKNCALYIKEPEFIQFEFFDEKLSKAFNNSITIKDIIASINVQNEANIDRKAQIQNSYQQEQINSYYSKCLKNFYPFSIIDRKTSIFGSAGLQRFFKNIYSQQTEKPIFFISVIGAKSAQKSKVINYLFGSYFYSENQNNEGGLKTYLCETIDSYIMIFDGEIKISNNQELNEEQVIYNHQLLVFLMKISNWVLITNFNQQSTQLIQQIKICNAILLDFLLNEAQKSRILEKIIVVLPQQAEENKSINDFRQVLALFKNFLASDIFIMPSYEKKQEREDYYYFILGLKNYIIRKIDQSRYSKRFFLQIYKNIKVQWQILQNVSHNQFKCQNYSTLTKYNQSLREIFDTIGDKRKKIQIFYGQQLIKAKGQVDKELSQNTLNASLFFINLEQFLKKIQVVQSQEIKQWAKSNPTLQNLRSFYSQRYNNDKSQYCREKITQYSQKQVNRIFYQIYFKEKNTSLDQQIQKIIEKGEEFLKDEVNQSDLIKYAVQTPLLKNIFQNLVESQHILKGLQINNIQNCLDLFTKIKAEFDLNIDLMVENYDPSQLSILQKASLFNLILKKVGEFDKYLKEIYSPTLTSEIAILDTFPSLLKIMDLNTDQLQRDIASSRQIRKQLYLVKINYKRYLLGKIFYECAINLSNKKPISFQKRIVRIQSLITQMKLNKQLLLEFQSYYQNIKKLIDMYRNEVGQIVWSRISQPVVNIVQISQLLSTSSLISNIDQQKQSIINSYKFVKNPEKYLLQIIQQQSFKQKQKRDHQLSIIIQNIILQIQENIKAQIKPQKTTNDVELYDSVYKQTQINTQALINQTKNLYQQQRKKIDLKSISQKIRKSICTKICPWCKAHCRIKVQDQKDHLQHEFRHLLDSFGGPSQKQMKFSYKMCHLEEELKIFTNQQLIARENKLMFIWANIENILVMEKYQFLSKYKPTQEIVRRQSQQYTLTSELLKKQNIENY